MIYNSYRRYKNGQNKYKKLTNDDNNDIQKIVTDKAYALYGKHLPKEIQERLDTELNSIIENELLLRDIAMPSEYREREQHHIYRAEIEKQLLTEYKC